MDYQEIISNLSISLNAFDQAVQEEITNDEMFYDYGRQAEMILRQELRLPIKEKDLELLTGERGVNLPTDFLAWADEEYPLRISPDGTNTEGDPIPLIPNSSMFN